MPYKDPEKRRAYARATQRKRYATRPETRAYISAWQKRNRERISEKMRIRRLEEPKYAYTSQKSAAKKRGIPWQLTFMQWWNIWEASGRWDDRGRGADQYCMARFGDVGPYSMGNVRIAPNQDNYQERTRTQSKESRQRQANALRGRPLSSEHREKISKAKLGKPKSAETRQKLREAAKAQWARHRGSLPT